MATLGRAVTRQGCGWPSSLGLWSLDKCFSLKSEIKGRKSIVSGLKSWERKRKEGSDSKSRKCLSALGC